MLCIHQDLGNGDFYCPQCKRTRRGVTALPLRTICPAADPTRPLPAMPGIVTRGWNYAKAKKRWKKAGKPVRLQVEIDALHNGFCLQCPFYNQEVRACSPCGCNVNTQADALKNKLAMRTEECPKGHWGPWTFAHVFWRERIEPYLENLDLSDVHEAVTTGQQLTPEAELLLALYQGYAPAGWKLLNQEGEFSSAAHWRQVWQRLPSSLVDRDREQSPNQSI